MRKRADFLACNKGRRQPMPGFVLLVRERQDGDPAIRLGITVTKKIGGAVVRNRMKRRFRALAREILPRSGIAGADHVLIGRDGGIERDYAALGRELEKALGRLSAPPGEKELERARRHAAGKGAPRKGNGSGKGRPAGR
ncbi:ribonuclease P protein component [Sphingobium jiangsuense]|nr:ribonuclease P protein component [Sphingobium jiangsuense]